MRAAVARLGIEHPVCIDADGLVWSLYDNEGWPARYLFDQAARLLEFHFGEGGYEETERAIQELLGIEREPLAPDAARGRARRRGSSCRPRTWPGRTAGPTTPAAVWAVLDGRGEIRVNGAAVAVEHPGAYEIGRAPGEHGGRARPRGRRRASTCLARLLRAGAGAAGA